jgi:hypothetical protein
LFALPPALKSATALSKIAIAAEYTLCPLSATGFKIPSAPCNASE